MDIKPLTSHFPYQIPPISNITPFTYRDGVTFLETLEKIRAAIRDNIIPELDANLAHLIREFQSGIKNAEDTIDARSGEWLTAFNKFMSDVEAALLPLNDAAVSILIKDAKSRIRAALDSIYTTKTAFDSYAKEIAVSADPLSHLNSVSILCEWQTRPAGTDTTYPQGIAINEDKKEIYVSNQGGTVLRVEIRNYDGSLKESRTITTDGNAYSQTLPYWYNADGHLCFMLRPGGGLDPVTGAFTYSVYNFTLGNLGPRIPIKGDCSGDVDNGLYYSLQGGNFGLGEFYVYDFESIKRGTPELVKTIPVPGSKKAVSKNQGMTVNGGFIFLLHGAAETNLTISVYNTNAELVTVHDYSIQDFAKVINHFYPGRITNTNTYTFENEGGTRFRGGLATLNVANNTKNMLDSRTYVTIHNVIGGQKLQPNTKLLDHDSNWIALELNPPFKPYHPTSDLPMVRRSGSLCMFAGGVSGLDVTPASQVVTRVPDNMRPRYRRQFVQSSSNGYTTNWQLETNGDLKIIRSRDEQASTVTWYPLPTMPWWNN